MKHPCTLTNKKTGTVKEFETATAACRWLGRDDSYISRQFKRHAAIFNAEGDEFDAVMDGIKLVADDRRRNNGRWLERFQLCFECAKSCGGCSWSRAFRPVDGWVAKPTIINQGYQTIESYQILACPQFERG